MNRRIGNKLPVCNIDENTSIKPMPKCLETFACARGETVSKVLNNDLKPEPFSQHNVQQDR